MTAEIEIQPYDPGWPELYEGERDRIMAAAEGCIVTIEHVGSTAVPGLGAKPVVDLMGSVRHLDDAIPCVTSLAEIGYVYHPEHEEMIPERRFFRKGLFGTSGPIYHLHLTQSDTRFWEDHLLFRDYLRAHDAAAGEYEALKQSLAERHGPDRDAYTMAKTPFIESVVTRARAWQGLPPRPQP